MSRLTRKASFTPVQGIRDDLEAQEQHAHIHLFSKRARIIKCKVCDWHREIVTAVNRSGVSGLGHNLGAPGGGTHASSRRRTSDYFDRVKGHIWLILAVVSYLGQWHGSKLRVVDPQRLSNAHRISFRIASSVQASLLIYFRLAPQVLCWSCEPCTTLRVYMQLLRVEKLMRLVMLVESTGSPYYLPRKEVARRQLTVHGVSLSQIIHMSCSQHALIRPTFVYSLPVLQTKTRSHVFSGSSGEVKHPSKVAKKTTLLE
ncbi:hypothetical protein VTK73DRAFT_9679 [Phialemonium thermophilum]|uniref:Uncharacterized protein n=1 Tax=Phialemonium thermophilum TaxID=223376 RepID=A0ABR3W115_9PEZI